MQLHVDQLTTNPTALHFEAKPGWWSMEGSDLVVAEPFHFDLQAHLARADVVIEGWLSGLLDAQCGRCLSRYRQPLREPFQLVLEPAGTRIPLDPEGAKALGRDGMCLGDELELGWYRGEVIRLDRFFAEVVALAIPFQMLCREDCPGLCAHCGIDRSKSTCGCEDSKADSPFAALAVLRDGRSGGSP